MIFRKLLCPRIFPLSSLIQSPLSSPPSIPPPQKEEKTEKEKEENRKKQRKLRRKREWISFDFFQLILPFLSQKEEKREEIRNFSFSIHSHFPAKKQEKQGKYLGERIKMEEKRDFHSSSLFRRKKKNGKTLFKNGNQKEENANLQGHEKEKDLVHHEDEQGLKTMRFYQRLTLNVFALEKMRWFCWNIVM